MGENVNMEEFPENPVTYSPEVAGGSDSGAAPAAPGPGATTGQGDQDQKHFRTVAEMIPFLPKTLLQKEVYLEGAPPGEDYPVFLCEEKGPRRRKEGNVLFVLYVKRASREEGVKCPALAEKVERAKKAFEEIAGGEVKAATFSFLIEAYEGDYKKQLGNASISVVTLYKETPFAGAKWQARKAWAVGYDWVKRLAVNGIQARVVGVEMRKYADVVVAAELVHAEELVKVLSASPLFHKSTPPPPPPAVVEVRVIAEAIDNILEFASLALGEALSKRDQGEVWRANSLINAAFAVVRRLPRGSLKLKRLDTTRELAVRVKREVDMMTGMRMLALLAEIAKYTAQGEEK